MFYSKSTGGFYCPEINENIPDDVVEITEEEHSSLLKKQSEGKRITSDDKGKPIVVENVMSVSEAKKLKIKKLESYRFEVETRGMIINDIFVDTSYETRIRLNEALTSLQSGFITDTLWKNGSDWITVNLELLTPIAEKIAGYIRACAITEKTHFDTIMGLPDDLTQIELYDISKNWPSNIYEVSNV